jgi:xanthine dehydrogenase accessory factor
VTPGHATTGKLGCWMNLLRPDKLTHDPVVTARDWLQAHGRIALATVVSTWGSSPVPVGGQLVIGPGDLFQGSVAGGCVEADVIAEAVDVMASHKPSLLEFGVSDAVAWRTGLPCGGNIKIFLECLNLESDAQFLERVLAARETRTPLVVLTDLAEGKRTLYDSADIPEKLHQHLESGQSCLIETSGRQGFLHILEPPVRLVIAGATHIGQILASLALTIGYEVVVLDPRAAFASDDRFVGASAVTGWPHEAMATIGLDRHTAIIALSHVADIDDDALTAALHSDCLYIGALGSRRTHEKRLDRLRAAGLTDASLGRIHAPVGLPIGAKGPAEIAVSILAEIIKITRRTA